MMKTEPGGFVDPGAHLERAVLKRRIV